jgi:hypothetical protein
MNEPINPGQLVDGPRLLELTFDERSRPSPRWLYSMTKRGVIPFVKIGHLVRFDPERVREALAKKCTVKARPDAA